MSENYYMYGYREPDQDLIDEVGELNVKIEDLELEISRLKDELSNAIPIEWLEQYMNNFENNQIVYAKPLCRAIITNWKKEKRKEKREKKEGK